MKIGYVQGLMAICVLGLFGVDRGMAQTNAATGLDRAPQQEQKKLRDPFWPVGYVPEMKTPEVDTEKKVEKKVQHRSEAGWAAAMKLVEIKGVSSRAGNEFFAVINGEVKQVGDSVSVKMNDGVYSWTVESITPPGSVKLRRETVE